MSERRRSAEHLVDMNRRWSERGTVVRLAAAGSPGWFEAKPVWATEPALNGNFQNPLWERGQVDWAWVLMGAPLLFERAAGVGWATLLFSDDVVVRDELSILEEIAQRIWSLRRAPSKAVGTRSLNAWVSEDRPPAAISPVPSSLSEGRVVWRAGVAVRSRDLPSTHFRFSLVPIVRDFSFVVPAVHLLPKSFWSPELLEYWESPKA